MLFTWKWGGGGSLTIYQMFAGSSIFKQKIFLQMEGVARVSHKIGHVFVVVLNIWPLHSLKLQPVQLLEAIVFFFNIKPPTRYILDIEQPQTPTPPPSSPPPPTHPFPPTPLKTKLKHLLLSVGTLFFYVKNILVY